MKLRALFKSIASVVVLIAVAASAAFWWWRSGGRPQRSGEARIAVLSDRVEVRFDDRAVPHVRAASLQDAARALGWLHANDRIGQMELMRRYVNGRLAEIVGEAAVRSDRMVRELRFPQTLEALHGALGSESRALLEAYAQGVNAWLEERGGDLPPDVRLLRVRPAPWSARDSLCVQMLMSQMLSHSVARELVRLSWVQALGARKASLLIGDALTNVPAATLEAATREYGERALTRTPPATSATSNGSNNWAVDASRSADGHALVANDPHLNLGLPSIWFQAQIRCPQYEAAGFTIPGMPLVVIGQGPRLAWGFTNTELDVCDAFLERVGDDGRSVERQGAFTPVRAQREHIVVRGEADVEFDALSTEIGPLLTWGRELRYSLAWTGHAAFDPVTPFLALARASSIADVPSAIAEFIGPPQNLVCGDANGAILFTLLGRNVERGAGDGRVPLLARDTAHHWRGLRPREQSPSASQPPAGALVTANNDTRPAGASYPYPVDAATDHRAQRIAERLAERRDWRPDSLGALQTDATSLYAREVAAALVEVSSIPGAAVEPDAQRALDALAAWDGELSLRGAAALHHLVEARIDEWLATVLGRSLSHPERDRVRLEALYGRLDEPFLAVGDAPLSGMAARREKLLGILAEAWREGTARFGPELESWRYGELHVWAPQHRLGGIPVLGRYFEAGQFEVPGAGTSPCVFSGARSRANGELPRTRVEHGASLRWVADCGAPDASLAVLPGGQSGHPFDPHYTDQIDDFLAGRLHPVRWSDSEIERAASSTLTLAP